MSKINDFLKNELVDTHIHFTVAKKYSSEDLEDASVKGVKRFLDVSVDTTTSYEIAQSTSKLLTPSFGIDPEVLIPGSDLDLDVLDMDNSEFSNWLSIESAKLKDLLKNHPDAWIGECGIDAFALSKKLRLGTIEKDTFDKSLNYQEELFRMQIELAQELVRPMTIHSRNKEKYCLDILKSYEVEAIFHSFSGGYKVAKEVLDAGLYLGINGIVTYDSAQNLREVYSNILGVVPDDADPKWFYDKGIVFETDAPYLKPFDSKALCLPSDIVQTFEYMRRWF